MGPAAYLEQSTQYAMLVFWVDLDDNQLQSILHVSLMSKKCIDPIAIYGGSACVCLAILCSLSEFSGV